MRISPNMSVSDALTLASKLGCEVHHKYRHGEIYIKHPEIEKPYLISSSKRDIGKAFISWIKPLTKGVIMNQESNQYTLALTMSKMKQPGKHINVDEISDYYKYTLFDKKMDRKKINDTLVHLNKKGFVYRTDIGVYIVTQKFMDLVYENAERIVQEPIEPVMTRTTKPLRKNEICETKPADEPADEPETMSTNEPADEPTTPQDSSALEHLVTRLEKVTNRLEKVVDKLQSHEDMKDVYKILEDVVLSRKNKGV